MRSGVMVTINKLASERDKAIDSNVPVSRKGRLQRGVAGQVSTHKMRGPRGAWSFPNRSCPGSNHGSCPVKGMRPTPYSGIDSWPPEQRIYQEIDLPTGSGQISSNTASHATVVGGPVIAELTEHPIVGVRAVAGTADLRLEEVTPDGKQLYENRPFQNTTDFVHPVVFHVGGSG